MQNPILEKQKSIAVIGSGPTGPMVSDVLSSSGYQVSLFEKRKGLGRKLLIAGSSGLNITNDLPPERFFHHYSGSGPWWKKTLSEFSPQDWIRFIESLGVSTFKGTSDRYFVQEMKASGFLKKWRERLERNQVKIAFDHECVDFQNDSNSSVFSLTFQNGVRQKFDAVCFALGGGSYESHEDPLRWPEIFIRNGVRFHPFVASNVGFKVHWKEAFLKEAEGKPLKNVELFSKRGRRKGEIIITRYGIEGTPVYFAGIEGKVSIDLKPDLTLPQLIAKCEAVKENLSPIRRVKKQLHLSESAMALLYHHVLPETLKSLPLLCRAIKSFPLDLIERQPLSEAISSSGGIDLGEITPEWMLRQFPGVFLGGEMLDWDAPTGGFLIQGCISQGFSVGKNITQYLQRSSSP